ncbi:MAG: hypothetical protein BroJett018_34990 [Chloroflexota bacterium]|nr:hypothetical protein [Chloroflexota bacterium]NOG63992.1 hypothetical protein [Chloroflexota bacterium]GIK65705.1 MAG: hypothetical protein BroJett018_34990 [Chloroflexota bacterium]
MLEKLDSIDWADIHRVYGEGVHFPQLIRDLTSPDKDVWYKAYESLREGTNHQNSIYPATPYVIPFLAELVQIGGFPSCPDIIELLGDYATSCAHLAKAKTKQSGEANLPQVQHGDRKYLEFMQRQKVLEHTTYQALEAALPILLDELNRGNQETRRPAFVAIMNFHTYHEITVPALAQNLDRVTLPDFLEIMPMRSWSPSYYDWVEYTKTEKRQFVPPLLQLMNTATDTREKYEIAFLLTILAEEETPPAAVDVLCEIPGHTPQIALTTLKTDEAIKRLRLLLSQSGDPIDAHDIAYAILEKIFIGAYRQLIRSSTTAVLRDTVYCRFELIDPSAANDMVRRFTDPIRTIFPKSETLLDTTALTNDQRYVLQLVVDNDLVWQHPSNLLELYGLPAERSMVRALLES